jgi:hypothetical protein
MLGCLLTFFHIFPLMSTYLQLMALNHVLRYQQKVYKYVDPTLASAFGPNHPSLKAQSDVIQSIQEDLVKRAINRKEYSMGDQQGGTMMSAALSVQDHSKVGEPYS